MHRCLYVCFDSTSFIFGTCLRADLKLKSLLSFEAVINQTCKLSNLKKTPVFATENVYLDTQGNKKCIEVLSVDQELWASIRN